MEKKIGNYCNNYNGLYRVRALEFRNGTDTGNYYNGLYRDYYKDPFLHS